MTPSSLTLIAARDGLSQLAMAAAGQPEADALVESYDAWREACSAVSAAYRDWEESPRSDRDAAFGGYLAALQQEQHTARLYQGRLELLRLAA
jgi:hypothetical protein